ncbi:hypothetical protein T05_4287 [Trichinella murrelli]|uniref:Uncharacterized protein n=1 Tax=Trichinella murrelli TaxID=144512 RepID=A0A0V0U8W3_9BILA|nr:hypothetical protein T05_4287 [Trichinella murrelli]
MLSSHRTAGFISFPIAPIKFATCVMFWKVPRQTNAYMSNKWPLKLSGAIIIHREAVHLELRLNGSAMFFDIIMMYSLKLPIFAQYFVVLGKSIFLDFRSISNKLKKVVLIWVEMCIKSSIC